MINYDNNISQFNNKIIDYNRNLGKCIKTFPLKRMILEPVDYNVSITSSTHITISIWLYVSAGVPQRNHLPLSLGAGITSNNRVEFRITTLGGGGTHLFWASGNVNSGNNNTVLSPNWLQDSWNSLTIIVKGVDLSDWEVYINGEIKALAILAPTPNGFTTDNKLSLGIVGTAMPSFMYISSMMLFNDELTSDHVNLIVKANGVCPRLLQDKLELYYVVTKLYNRYIDNLVGSDKIELYGYTDEDIESGTNITYCDSYTLLPIIS